MKNNTGRLWLSPYTLGVLTGLASSWFDQKGASIHQRNKLPKHLALRFTLPLIRSIACRLLPGFAARLCCPGFARDLVSVLCQMEGLDCCSNRFKVASDALGSTRPRKNEYASPCRCSIIELAVRLCDQLDAAFGERTAVAGVRAMQDEQGLLKCPVSDCRSPYA